MNLRSLLAISALLLGALCLRGELMLKGVVISGSEPLFSRHSVEDKTSRWVSLGQSFSGYEVVAFDPQTESVSVAKDGIRREIRLQGSVVRDSTAEDAEARLRSLQGMELAYELAKQGDAEIGKLLVNYQNIVLRHRQVTAELDNQDPKKVRMIEFLSKQLEELRSQVEKTAAASAAFKLRKAGG